MWSEISGGRRGSDIVVPVKVNSRSWRSLGASYIPALYACNMRTNKNHQLKEISPPQRNRRYQHTTPHGIHKMPMVLDTERHPVHSISKCNPPACYFLPSLPPATSFQYIHASLYPPLTTSIRSSH